MSKKRRNRPVAATQKAPTPAPAVLAPTAAGQDSGHWIGFTVLAAIAAFAGIWLYVQGARAASPPSPVLAPMTGAVDPARFRPDAWFLPAGELLGFVEIPVGSFLMGSDPVKDRLAYENERWSATQLQGKVMLPGFYIARYETTVAQYRAFVEATGHSGDAQSLRGAADHPVVNVSWTDALAYARWLEIRLRDSAHTPQKLRQLLAEGWHVSLPSEAEWEKAARGTDGRVYPWGNEASRDHANFGGRGTAAVGSLSCERCAHTLSDMSGNVWELTRSPLQPYPWDASDRAANPQADALFVMRGGSFAEGASNVRAAVRGGIDPGARRPFIGFRIVITGGAPTSSPRRTPGSKFDEPGFRHSPE